MLGITFAEGTGTVTVVCNETDAWEEDPSDDVSKLPSSPGVLEPWSEGLLEEFVVLSETDNSTPSDDESAKSALGGRNLC